MNKSELVDSIAQSANISKVAASNALDAFTAAVSKSLQDGESVTLIGFGTFSLRTRQARSGRNPRTGEVIQLKASKVPGFKAGKALKEAVNK